MEFTEGTPEHKALETIYVVGDVVAFEIFIKQNWDNVKLVGIEGHFRWVLTNEDGTRVIVRPEESKPKDEH